MPPPADSKRKRIVVEISDDEDETSISIASDSDDEVDEESVSEGDDSDFAVDVDESDDDDDSDRDSDSDDDDGDENEESGVGEYTDEERWKKVVDRLDKQKSLDLLKLEDCKSYLRKHSLRLSGSKSTCIKRIMEHWRIKDTDGEKLYPRSSFTINCTGDVCKGDVVLFNQRVYEKFDKVKRSSKVIGKRTVAGRIVKESYGAAKQQHTFTVEVLWTKGQKVLPHLYPLLVKGRNLYRLKTYRQAWSNEAERIKVLDEKHRRGAVARQIRQIRQTRRTQKAGPSSHEHLSGARHAPKVHSKEQLKHAPKRRKQNNLSDKASVKTNWGAKQSVVARNAPEQTTRSQGYSNYAGRSECHPPGMIKHIPVARNAPEQTTRSQGYSNYAGQSKCHPPRMMKHIPMPRNPSAQFHDRQAHYSERFTHFHHPSPPRMPFHDNYNGLNTQHNPAFGAQPQGSFASHHDRWNSAQVPWQPTFSHGYLDPSNTQFHWWRRP